MTALNLPKVILGTSCLGNLYVALPYEIKCAIVSAYIKGSNPDEPVFFDTAGKYGAGLALECLGKCLRDLKIESSAVSISNKLGWLRTELIGTEPTFENGVWKELKYDAVQKISYDGILECYEQGNMLLQSYQANSVSVHDPDEYLASDAKGDSQRYQDIMNAYVALKELKAAGKVNSVGVGAKNWQVIARICQDIQPDWIMIANSMTVHSHPKDLLGFIKRMKFQGVHVINSAVFNAGFLIGGSHYNYRYVDQKTPAGKRLHLWRERFFKACASYNLTPAAVCAKFGIAASGISSIALSASSLEHIEQNIGLIHTYIPKSFWHHLYQENLISEEGLNMTFGF